MVLASLCVSFPLMYLPCLHRYSIHWPSTILTMWNISTAAPVANLALNSTSPGSLYAFIIQPLDTSRLIVFASGCVLMISSSTLEVLAESDVPSPLDYASMTQAVVMNNSAYMVSDNGTAIFGIMLYDLTDLSNISTVLIPLDQFYIDSVIGVVIEAGYVYIATAFRFMFEVSLQTSSLVSRIDIPSTWSAFLFQRMLVLVHGQTLDEAFLDCSPGSVRNFTSGECQTCQLGSVVRKVSIFVRHFF